MRLPAQPGFATRRRPADACASGSRGTAGPGRRRRLAAFTLIEILAVVAILALVATVVLPNFGALRDRRLRNEAQRLAGQLELARERSVVTGVPHRVEFDLENDGYRVEWLRGGKPPPPPPDIADLDLRGSSPLPLSAPPQNEDEYKPIPGEFGRFRWLERPLFIAGLETPDGWIDHGDSYVGFTSDGTATATKIVLEDDSGRRVVLAVEPLEDAVRVLDEAA